VLRIHSYDAYGREGAAAHLGRFGYAGGVALPESGLTHFRARAYDPGTGRFVSADPIGVAGGINLYGYSGGDPVNNVDPSGLAACPGPECIVVTASRKQPGHLENYLQRSVHAVDLEPTGNLPAAPAASQHDTDLTCEGTATFSAVGPLPQAAGDSAFDPGHQPQSGTVAIAGASTFGFGRKALREGAAGAIQVSPSGLDDILRSTGGPLPPYSVGDYGDANVRNAPGSRFDIYRFPTMKGARAFGKRTATTTYKVPAGGHCPPNSTPK